MNTQKFKQPAKYKSSRQSWVNNFLVDSRSILYGLLISIFLICQPPVTALALSNQQRALLKENILYYDEEAACTDTPVTPPAGAGNNKIYVIGDSLTIGMRDSGDLESKLKTKGWDVTGVEATTGITIDDSIPKIAADKNNAVSKADTVIVGLGSNKSSDPEKQIDLMVKAIHKANANAQIFWINAYSSKSTAALDYTNFNKLLTKKVGSGEDKIDKVINWAKEAKDNPDKYDLAADRDLGLHMGPDGYKKRVDWLMGEVGVPSKNSATGKLNLAPIVSKYSLQSVIVKEVDGKVLGEYHSTTPPSSPASTMKVIIADVLLRESSINLSKRVKITKDVEYSPGATEDKTDWKRGDTITLEDALSGMLSKSSNIGANLIMKELGGTAGFTKKANDAGYKDTKVTDYYNEDGGNNKSTIADQANAMDHIITSSNNRYNPAKSALGLGAKHDNQYDLDDYKNKWGGTNDIASNVGAFQINDGKYIIGLYFEIPGSAGYKSDVAHNAIHNGTADIIKELEGSSGAGPTTDAETASAKISRTFILGFNTSTPKSAIRDVMKKYKVGGIFILGNDADAAGFNKSFFDDLEKDAGHPLIISSDEEGVINRYKYSFDFPTAKEMGKMSESDVKAIGKKAAGALKDKGVNTDLAPVLDVAKDSSGTDAGTAGRAFSDDEDVVTKKAGAFAEGLKAGGVNPVYKHFPGLGSTSGNSDLGSVTSPSLSELKKKDLKPFEALVNKNGGAVMMDNAHIPGLTKSGEVASTSSEAVALLRDDYKFKGMITTDDLGASGVPGSLLSQSITKSLKAGVDMPLFGYTDTATLDAAIASVKAADIHVEASLQRIDDFIGTTTPGDKSGSNAVGGSCCPSGDSGSGGGSTTLTGKERGDQVFNYFIKQGFTNVQAAAITGNLEAESSFSSTVYGGGGGSYFGLAQWSTSRAENLKKKPNYTDLSVQLDYVMEELKSSSYSSTLAKLKSGDSLENDLVYIFVKEYEGATSNSEFRGVQNYKRRLGFAQEWLKKANGGDVSSTGGDSSSCDSGGSSGSGGSSIAEYKNPYRDVKQQTPKRIDMGVDYGGKGPVYAIGTATIDTVFKYNSGSGWPGEGGASGAGGWVSYTLKEGPAAGKHVYFAENCQPRSGITAGKEVTADTVICDLNGLESSWSESGWAAGVGSSAKAGDVYSEGDVTAYGLNFSDFIVKLGQKPGVKAAGAPIVGSLEANWPKWK